MPEILQLSNADVINIHRIRDTPSYRRLRPYELTSQRGWAVGKNCKNVPEYMAEADIAAVLNAAPILNVAPASDYISGAGQNNSLYMTKVDTKKMSIMSDTRYARSIKAPSTSRIKFRVDTGDQGEPNDPVGVRHRSELTSGSVTFAGGTEIWLSYAMRFNTLAGVNEDNPLGIADVPGAFAITGQWHGNDAKTPPFSLNWKDGKMGIWTTSSANLSDGTNGTLVERWRASTKTLPDVWQYVVVRSLMAAEASAILQFWLNGALILDLRPSGGTGVMTGGYGYYAIGGFAAYLNAGLYCADFNHPDVVTAGPAAVAKALAAKTEVEYANIEWGTTSLLGRVTTPLPIT